MYGGRGYDTVGTNTLYEYDPVTKVWASKGGIPISSAERYDVAGGVIADKLYVAGGIRDGASLNTARGDTWSYDPAAGKWAQVASMPWPKYLAAGAVVYGRLYVDGGNNADGSIGGSLLMYDPVTNIWSEIQNNLRAQSRRDHAAVGVGSKMYVYCAVGAAPVFYQVE